MKQNVLSPNFLTICRILLIPVFAITFFIAPYWVSMTLFLIASITDFLDGYIARKYDLESKLGKVMDPLADKLLIITALLCFAIKNVIHYSMAIAIIIIDVIIILFASFLLKKDVIIKSNFVGKMGTFIIIIGVLLSYFELHIAPYHIYVLYLGIVMVFSSAISYYIAHLKIKTSRKNLDKKEK